ncbi:hypothetical protein B9G55_00740 [Saccharibacillus sp. O16]|nr:hypothetical protein B9G55_00740 [Saccharibacillus sp. O16]
MKRRPLVGFTICWVAGTVMAHLYKGWKMAAIGLGFTFLLAALAWGMKFSTRSLLILGAALWLSAAYGTYRDAQNVTVLAKLLELPDSAVGEDYAGIQLEGEMAGPARIDGDLAMFELDVQRAAGSKLTVDAKANSSKPVEETDSAAKSSGKRASQLASGSLDSSGSQQPVNPSDTLFTLPRTERVVVRVKLAAEEEQQIAASWGRGDQLRVSGNLELPSEARNFGAFDYQKYLHEKRIHWVLRSAGAISVQKLRPAQGGLQLLRRNDELRASLAGKLAELYPGIGAGYMQGLLLGLQDGLDPETYVNFARLGMTHVLAISGMHVGLYVGAVLLLLRRLGITKQSSLLAALCFVPPYVLLTGSSPSAVRAGLMSMIALYAARRGWLKDGLHILCLAALLMLVWDPYYLTSISFQLSFAVTAGIILLTRPMQQILGFLPRVFAGGAAISLVADWVSFPLSIYYFNQYSLLGLAANLLLVPLISFVSIPLGTVSLILSGFWMQGAEWAAYPVRLINAAVFWSADGAGSIRWMRTIWASPSPVWIGLYLAALCGGLFAAVRLMGRPPGPAAPGPASGDTVPLASRGYPRASGPQASARSAGNARAAAFPALRGGITGRRSFKQPLRVAAAVLVLGGLLTAAYLPRPHSAGRVQMLDVGQGDAILITTPTGKHLLVDGGGTVTFERPGQEWRRRLDPYEVGRDVLVPLLKKRGVHRLDAVILTHGDRDHYGGLAAVFDEIPVERLIMNGTRSGGEDLDQLLSLALSLHTEIDSPQDGDSWSPDSHTKLEFWNPSGAFAGSVPELEEQNEYSVVFRMEMNGHSFVFTGDIGEQAEAQIINRLASRSGGVAPVEVLKVGHHGSKHSTSEDWVRLLSPQLSLISVGEHNTYGHPNPGIMDRLKQAGSQVLRTDQSGEIQIEAPSGQPLGVRTRLDGN